MKMRVWILIAVLLIALAPTHSFGARDPETTIQGKVESYTCVTEKRSCITEPGDPAAMAQDCFVVLLPDGKYYFIVNVDCKFMAAVAAETVIVRGAKDPKYDAIKAHTIEVIRGGKPRLIYSRDSWINPPPKPSK